MSVLIEDMKMPDKCINCPFMVSRDNDDCILQSEAANGRFETWDDMKAECPLAETQPESKWIPCRETVDIPDHEILACDKYGEEMFGYLSYEDDQWLCVSDDCMMYDPIAWREKPEPYLEEGE